MDPKKISIHNYTYELPVDKIALHPLAVRDEAKLLVYRDGEITSDIFKNLVEYLPADALLVLNDTKVVYSRLLFPLTTGSIVEVFCLEPAPLYGDIATGMLQQREVYWKCMVGKISKWKDKILRTTHAETGAELTAEIIEKYTDCFLIHLRWNSALSFAEVLQQFGAVPLPPYIKRKAEEGDKLSYQTIYSKHEGSVAAPTAGLHFTEAVLQSLQRKNISTAYVTLHVGAGTFKPVKGETMQAHDMHAEWLDVPLVTIEKITQQLAAQKPTIVVGTTAMRTVESLYWLAMKILHRGEDLTGELHLGQWEAYESIATSNPVDILIQLQNLLRENAQSRLVAKTQLLIAPAYRFKMVDALVTNFHQPNSTLLLLVAAAIGDDWKRVYDFALQNDFRFLSYGDSSLLYLKK